ncbi:MAG: hypothetical protein SXV54_10270 [Chloroflexota bacterium]|nr:hypothetical protein [Chloroflexota bacterium]
MTTAEERIRVLEMIQSGQVTAEEGARLLEALRGQERRQESQAREPQQLHIRVTDLETGRQKVDIRMPWSLVNVGVSMGARFAREEIRLEEFADVVQTGAESKIMDVVDEEEGERVEIFVE